MSVPAPPPGAEQIFGAQLPLARRYAELLCTTGVERGLLGPAEPERIWPRHLLNCAAAAAQLPASGSCLDLGSGAGLPGIVLALLQPELTWILLDSTRRRVTFLDEVVAELGIADRVETRWARAEDLTGHVQVDTVVARAVASLPRLWQLARPLLRRDGVLVAMKGAQVDRELADFVHRAGKNVRATLVCEEVAGEAVRLVRVSSMGPSASDRGAGRRSVDRRGTADEGPSVSRET